jgi:hypothetical protein
VVSLVGAVARPEAEPLEELDQRQKLVERLLGKKLIAEPDGAIIPRLRSAGREARAKSARAPRRAKSYKPGRERTSPRL